MSPPCPRKSTVPPLDPPPAALDHIGFNDDIPEKGTAMTVPAKSPRNTTKKTPARTTRKTSAATAKPATRAPRRPRKSEPTREQIAEAAYYIWQDKGRPQGRDQDHWLEAEQQLREVTPKRKSVRKKQV
jgi:hypothetical protein